MIVRDKWEIAARYSEIDPNDEKDDDGIKETTIGVNRYFKNLGHSLKLNVDATWLDTERAPLAGPPIERRDDLSDVILRSQLQVTF